MRQILLCVALLAIAPSAHAGATVWIAGTGNWNTPGNWSGGDVPDMLGDVAVIPLDTAVVNLNISPTIDGVAITTAGARLNLGGFTLNVTPLGLDTTGLLVANTGVSTLIGNVSNTGVGAGRGIEVTGGAILTLTSPTITNSGRIDVNPTNAGAVTLLRFDADTALNGSGSISLSGVVNRAQLDTSGAFVLTQASGHTIRGVGQLHASLVNNGIVSADVPANVLTLMTNSKTNNFLFRAINGGFLDITGITVTQTPFSTISADASTVRISGCAIDQGTLESTNAGLVALTSGTNTLTSVTIVGDVDAVAATSTVVTGTGLHNLGTLEINPTNAASVTTLRFAQDGSLSGTGNLKLSGVVNRAQLNSEAGVTITQDNSHTIHGMGQINAALINNGLISADVPGNILALQTNPKTNNSLIEAINGSFLDITGITITQTPFSIIAADAATVRLSSAAIDMGNLQAINGGEITLVSGLNSLNSVSIVGPAKASAATTTVVTGAGVSILDTLEINPTNAGSVTILRFDNNASLSGAGTLLLSGIVNRAQLNSAAAVTVTNDAGNTIRGIGQINADLINNGLISADVPGNSLALQTSPKTNNNLFSAVNGAFLDISNITVTQTPFSVISADASTVRLSGAHISQGTLQTLNGGLISLPTGVNTLTSVNLVGFAQASAGTTTIIDGTGLVNNGTLEINPTNAAAVTACHFDADGFFFGTGQLVLKGIVNRAQLNTALGVTVTNDAGHTIRGIGQINASLINNGVIEANTLDTPLTLLTSNKANNNLIRAINGSFLDFTGITLTQSTFAEVLADASTVRLSNATLSGGTLRAINAGLTQAVSSVNTLDALNNQCPIDQFAATTLRVTGGGLSNSALIRVNPANTAAVTDFQFTAGGFLDGTGTLLLGGIVNRARLTSLAGTITQGSGHTIGGIGQITAAPLINNGTIAPGGPSAGILAVEGNVTQTPSGILHFELGGTAVGQFGVLAGAGTINLGGTLRAVTINGHIPPPAATYAIITTTNRPGRFAAFDLPPGDWRVEYLSASVRLAAGPHCLGDANFDNIVNFADITAVLANFNVDYFPAPGTGPGDSTRDGIVNFADVTSTLANFNVTCP